MTHAKSLRAIRLERRSKLAAQAPKLNLVSLMDIFTILVFFLLVNSSAVEVLPNTKHLELPKSVAEQRARETLVLMVSKEDVLVGGEAVLSLADVEATTGKIIGPLKSRLLQEKLIPIEGQPGRLTRGEINIMADRGVPYSVLKKIMATFSETRYARISLAVLQELPKTEPEA